MSNEARPFKDFSPQTRKPLRDGEPCNHPGCLRHLSHPCDGCGRIGGRTTQPDEARPFREHWVKYLLLFIWFGWIASQFVFVLAVVHAVNHHQSLPHWATLIENYTNPLQWI